MPCVTLFAISSPRESRRSAIVMRLGRLRANVLERALYVHAHHLLSPRESEVGVVHRLGGAIGRVGRGTDGALIETRADDGLRRLRNLLRIRGDRAQNDACPGDAAIAGEVDTGGDSQHREVERVATAE